MNKTLIRSLLFGFLLLAGCGGGGGASDSAQDPHKIAVRAHLDDAYFWYDEILDVPAPNYATAPQYFDALLVRSRDRFSYSMPVTQAVANLQEGLETGLGVRWGWVAPRRLFAFYVDPNSPAASYLTRGTELILVNGRPLANLSNSDLYSAIFPNQLGSSVDLTLRYPGTSTIQTKNATAATFSTTTVVHPLIIPLPGGGKAGYLLFNEHLRTAEQGLSQAVTFLKEQGITELVLDMRYNGGGYLIIAEELASMIGGAAVQGKVFERLLFNAKHPERSQDSRSVYRFSALDSKGGSLPLLGLSRVFVLTGGGTCSASESIINGLLPYVQVVTVGNTTCGKPYGSRQINFGDQAYFAIEFEGVNANGSGDYKAGFAPTCSVADDLNYPLGDTREERLKAALYYASNNRCPSAVTVTLPKAASSETIPVSGDVQMIGEKPGQKLH